MTIRRFRTLRNAGVTGFSAIELAIALAIVGILTAVAYPSYQLQIAKGRRADGTTLLPFKRLFMVARV